MIVCLSGTLAYAADLGLMRSLATLDEARPPLSRQQAEMRWIDLESAGADGVTRHLRCLEYAEMVTTDVVAIPAIALDDFIAESCSALERW